MYQLQPDDINIHFELPPETFDFDVIAIDTEWFNQDKSKLHRPHGDFGCLGCTTNGKDIYMIFDTDEIINFYMHIHEGTHVYANALYDIRQLRRFASLPDRKAIWDVITVEQIRYSGYYGGFALNDLARRYCDIYMPKDVRETFGKSKETTMTDEQIFYAATDIACTWFVAKKQMEEIDDDDKNIWEHVERPFLWTLLDTKGFMLDAEKWTTRFTEDQRKADEILASLPFNPNSHVQIKEYFKKKYKITLSGTAEDVLAEVATEHPEIEELQMIMDARHLRKAASTYGQYWLDSIEEDGRIYCNWKQVGAVTGRMSAGSSEKATKGSIAVQTLPHETSYRECIVAAPDHTILIADYSSQEPKELAYITGDLTLIKIFKDKKDVYIEVGYQVFNERFDKKDPRRQQMKSIILGVSYGMSKYGLAHKLGISVDDAEQLLNVFFKKFPAVKKWVSECAVWKPYTTSILGRKFWGNRYSNGWQRNYQNHPMQASAVDCTKMAASLLRKKLGYNPFIIYMHDELVVEVDDGELEKVKTLLEECMVSVQEWMADGLIPGGVEIYVGKNYSAK